MRVGHHVEVAQLDSSLIGGKGALIENLVEGSIDMVFPRFGAKRRIFVDQLTKDLEDRQIRSINSYESLKNTQYKYQLYQTLNEHHLLTPRTWIARGLEGFEQAFKEAGNVPMVIKGMKHHEGNSIFYSPTPKAAEKILSLPEFRGGEFLVQEFISESCDESLRAFVVGGRVVAAMRKHNETSEDRSNLFSGGHADSIRLKSNEGTLALRAVKALGLQVASVDLIRCARKCYILDVNAAPDLYEIEKITHVNVAEKVIELAENICHLRDEYRQINFLDESFYIHN